MLDGGVDVTEVGVAVTAAARRSDCDENNVRSGDRSADVVAKAEPSGRDVAFNQRVEAGLVDGDLALLENAELRRVGLDDGYLHAEIGEASARDQSDIAAANDRNTHGYFP